MSSERHMFRAIAAALLVALAATQAAAQSPERRAPTVDDVVVVTKDESTPLRGQLLKLGPETLTLLTKDGQKDVELDAVKRIDARKDSVKNGAIIGAAILGGWCALICAQGVDNAGDVGALLIVSTLWGGLIGAGIDAAHTGTTPIFRAPSEETTAFVVPKLKVAKKFSF